MKGIVLWSAATLSVVGLASLGYAIDVALPVAAWLSCSTLAFAAWVRTRRA